MEERLFLIARQFILPLLKLLYFLYSVQMSEYAMLGGYYYIVWPLKRLNTVH